MLRVLDLFSGIGGFSLGLERTGGFRTVAFCEIDPYCRAVLAKHWPGVPIFSDVRSLGAGDAGSIDVICGGFPCQDVSEVGARAGIAGEQSGLWREMCRLVREIKPRYLLVENVAGLLDRGLGNVLGDLAASGFDAEWSLFPACTLGAPHSRGRVFLVAYPDQQRSQASGRTRNGDDAAPHARRERSEHVLATALSISREIGEAFASEPSLDRVAHGVPYRVDRLRALGNAVVPQIPEIIGRAILEAEGMTFAL